VSCFLNRAMLGGGLLLVSVCGAAAKDCDFDSVRLFHNQTAETHMTVKAGKRCSVYFGGTDGAVTETLITQKARVGTASTENSRVVYAAKTGFNGSDEFTYGRRGTDRYGNPSLMSAHIVVTVVP
jgi:hypothetical protein